MPEYRESLRNIYDSNQKQVEKETPDDIVIGSMDFVTLYPTLELEETSQVIETMMMKSPITYEEVNLEEAMKLLALTLPPETLS